MKKCIALVVLGIFVHTVSHAQNRMRPMRRGPYHQRTIRTNLPPFKPSASISIGYGFPNLDKDQFVQFYNYYPGNASPTGQIHGSLDYQFNRNASIGVMASHGKISMPYYGYNDPVNPALRG